MRERRFLTYPHTPRLLPVLLAFLVVLLISGHSIAQTIRYVKAGGTGDGYSWAGAAGNLQATTNASSSGHQVWVASGEYQPEAGSSFSMKEGLKIYGGFAGTEQTLQERNHRTYVSILKGNGNSVVRNSRNGLTAQAVLDGFTLTGSNANMGGGIYNYYVSPTLANLTIRSNKALREGGGAYFEGGAPALTHLTVSGNEAGHEGAGLLFRSSSPHLFNVLISGNLSANGGGGIQSRAPYPDRGPAGSLPQPGPGNNKRPVQGGQVWMGRTSGFAGTGTTAPPNWAKHQPPSVGA